MKYIFINLLIFLAAFILGACKKTNTENFYAGGQVPSKYVYLFDDKFSPANVTYYRGAYVTFSNLSTRTHKLISTDSTINSGLIAPGKSHTLQFLNIGTYDYHCTEHNEQGTIEIIN